MNALDRDDRRGAATLAALLGVSLAAHVAILGAFGPRAARGAPARRRPVEVTMQVAPAPAAAQPAPAAPRPRVVAHRIAAPAPAAPRAPTPTPEEAPADFSGVTLTSDGAGPGWTSAVGNGGAMRAPVGAPGARVAPATRASEPPLVALASLSRAPSPPDLADVLERHYPETARRQGLAGHAVLKARIAPDGRPRDLVLLSESTAGFGDACRATLRDSVWTAPLDRDGRAVATLVTYTCRFEVR